MTTLVTNDPDTGTDKTSGNGVQGVKADPRSVVGGGRQCEPGQERVNVKGAVDQPSEQDRILEDIERRLDSRSMEAVGRDGIQQLLDGKVGKDELLTLGDFLFLSLTNELSLFALPSRRGLSLTQGGRHFRGRIGDLIGPSGDVRGRERDDLL